MKISSSVYYAFGVSAAVLLLAGCSAGGSQSQLAPSGSILQPSRAGVSGVVIQHPDRRRSWMAPDAKKKDLLYISDEATADVYVFSYPKGKLMGTLTGFPEPQGECVDKKGDVFVTNFGKSVIIEYAHGGTSPIATLSDSGEYIEGCSVDPTTGNLAVVDFEPSSGAGNGGVAVYAKAKGTPTVYTDPDLLLGYALGYDNKGNIFLDGVNGNRDFEFAELPKGSSSFTTIPLSVTINTPGGVQWDGKHVAVGDATGGVIYQTTGAGGKIVGSTTLTGSDGVFQFFIDRNTVVGPDVFAANANFWSYPAGGAATKTLTGFADPFGSAVSKGRK
jgi:hypothetical protein